MPADPRRNIAATAAGILGVGLFVAIDLFEPSNPFNILRVALLLVGLLCLVAGAWPSRRIRFLLLLISVPSLLLLAVLAMFSVGLEILVVLAVAAYALVIEYAREGRE